MKMSLLDIFAPHYCCSCGMIGAILCDNCKNNIIDNQYSGCIACGKPAARYGLCRRCRAPFARAWCVGERANVLKALINQYKFERARAAKHAIVDLLDAVLPPLPGGVTVVPVPTIPPHIRQRGYDHMALVARGFACRRQLSYRAVIQRASNTVQHGTTRAVRLRQAKQAFECGDVPPGIYLLVDDVYTTGATVRYAADVLLRAGATEVWIAVVSRQTFSRTANV